MVIKNISTAKLTNLIPIVLLFFISNMIHAQLVVSNPEFIYPDQPLTIIFDASQGNAALKNTSGDIYAHIGLLTITSTNSSDWKYAT